jgi:hypothetical protein
MTVAHFHAHGGMPACSLPCCRGLSSSTQPPPIQCADLPNMSDIHPELNGSIVATTKPRPSPLSLAGVLTGARGDVAVRPYLGGTRVHTQAHVFLFEAQGWAVVGLCSPPPSLLIGLWSLVYVCSGTIVP